MSKFLIEYNPYTVTTEITLNGKPVAENSRLNINNKRLQEWVKKAPAYLRDECNDNTFEIEFLGTKMDFEDLRESVEKYSKGLNIKLSHLPVNEPENIENDLKKIFNELTEGPIEELKSKELKEAFERIHDDELDITVMATMSSGKSTLINALLQKEIMPSSHEASTATIIEVKDTNFEGFSLEALNENKERVIMKNNVNLKDMEELNRDNNISRIRLTGKIPFLNDEETSLLLIDTPGPNNSREESHGTLFEKTLRETSKSLVLYVLNATQLGIQDDKYLLDKVANSMQNDDKQSKDRYIFVVNKLDQFRQGKDDVQKSLKTIQKNLAEYGINDPHIFPASARAAFNIRRMLNEPEALEEEERDETEFLIRKLNRNDNLHLEKYTESLREIHTSDQGTVTNTSDAQSALIHTGIPAIEDYINLYIRKYAKTVKIKNLIDIFNANLKSSEVLEKTKQEIHSNTEKHDEIREKIEIIQSKILSEKKRKEFESTIDNLSIKSEIVSIIKEANHSFQKKLDEILKKRDSDELSLEEAENLTDQLKQDINDSFVSIKVNLEEKANEVVISTANDLLSEYIDMITNIYRDTDTRNLKTNPIELVRNELADSAGIDLLLAANKFEKKVKVDEKEKANPEREGFFGKLKFWKPKYITEDIYEKKDFISYKILINEISALVENEFRKMLETYEKSVEKTIEELKLNYKIKFDEINFILNQRLEELKEFTNKSKLVEEKINESREKLEWINKTEQELESMTTIKRR